MYLLLSFSCRKDSDKDIMYPCKSVSNVLLFLSVSKAKRELGWQPKVKFEELIKIMVKADWAKAQMSR